MDRGSSASFQAEIIKEQNQPVHLLSIAFDSGTVYMNDGYKSITYDGDEYLGVGHFLAFSDIEETADLAVASLNIALSGIDRTYISYYLTEDYIDREVKIHLAFLDTNQALVADPVLIFDGRMNAPSLNENPESGESTLTVNVSNAWVDFERRSGRHTNHEEQQIYFSGDKGFEFASQIVADIKWGRE